MFSFFGAVKLSKMGNGNDTTPKMKEIKNGCEIAERGQRPALLYE